MTTSPRTPTYSTSRLCTVVLCFTAEDAARDAVV
jgi:hypothetical protein